MTLIHVARRPLQWLWLVCLLALAASAIAAAPFAASAKAASPLRGPTPATNARVAPGAPVTPAAFVTAAALVAPGGPVAPGRSIVPGGPVALGRPVSPGGLVALGRLVSPGGPVAPEGLFEGERRAAVAEVIESLEELALWCQAKRLYAERDLTYRALFFFDEEHAEARRFLKYCRAKDGSWQQSSSYRAPKSQTSSLTTEFLARRNKIARDYSETLEKAANRLTDRRQSEEALAQVWSDLLAIDSEDKLARARRGEVRHPAGADQGARQGTWVLAETARAVERRALLSDAVRSMLAAGIGLRRSDLSAEERAIPVPWAGATATENVRVAGTATMGDLEECAGYAEAAVQLFRKACAVDMSPKPFSIFVLPTQEDREQFERHFQAVDADLRREMSKYTSYWLPVERVYVVCDQLQPVRLRQIARQTTALLMFDEFGIARDSGCVFEGLCTYVVDALLPEEIGSLPAAQDRAVAASMNGAPAVPIGHADSTWWNQAKAIPALPSALSLEALTGSHAAEMTRDDALFSYALVRYMVEGRPEEGRRLLGMIGERRPFAAACQVALKESPDRLEQRLMRWLEEAP